MHFNAVDTVQDNARQRPMDTEKRGIRQGDLLEYNKNKVVFFTDECTMQIFSLLYEHTEEFH